MSILNELGIYPESIEHTQEICEEVLEKTLLGNLFEEWKTCVSNNFHSNSKNIEDSFTNYVIALMFDALKWILTREYPGLETDFYVNGYDSHFYIKDNELFSELFSANVDVELIRKIMKHNLPEKTALDKEKIIELAGSEFVINDLIKAYDHGNDLVIYDSIGELGEDNKENACREEDASDEAFGYFLLQAYKQGHSNTLYYQFNDGEIIAVSLE